MTDDMIPKDEAHTYALAVLRQRMAHPRFDRSEFDASTQGAGGPDKPGWMVNHGVMHVPGNFARDASHRFHLSALFAEIESPQQGLFA